MSASSVENGVMKRDETIRLRDFFPGAHTDIMITRPENLFLPDAWTKTFAHGLEKLSAQGAKFGASPVLEVGVGTGINMAGLLTARIPPADYTGTDICDNAIHASGKLAAVHGWSVKLQRSDLLSDLTDAHLATIRHIVACIPQVPAHVDLAAGDNAAHYYKPTGSQWDAFGLGLNAALLKQASARAPNADITLNLAGRPGIGRLETLFRQHGYAPSVLHTTMVPQHGGTSLAPLAALEDRGCTPFEFFADGEGRQKLSARQAELRRAADQPLYHKIYVVTAPAQKPES